MASEHNALSQRRVAMIECSQVFQRLECEIRRGSLRRVATLEMLAKAVGGRVSQFSGVATRRAHRGASWSGC